MPQSRRPTMRRLDELIREMAQCNEHAADCFKSFVAATGDVLDVMERHTKLASEAQRLTERLADPAQTPRQADES